MDQLCDHRLRLDGEKTQTLLQFMVSLKLSEGIRICKGFGCGEMKQNINKIVFY